MPGGRPKKKLRPGRPRIDVRITQKDKRDREIAERKRKRTEEREMVEEKRRSGMVFILDGCSFHVAQE